MLPRDLQVLSVLCAILCFGPQPPAFCGEKEAIVLRGDSGVAAVFEQTDAGYVWTGYEDQKAGHRWTIGGPWFSVQTPDGHRANLGDFAFRRIAEDTTGGTARVIIERSSPLAEVSQEFSFCEDGRTLCIQTALRAAGGEVTIQRAGLLEIKVAGQAFALVGPAHVSWPVFGDRVFAGIEHPSAWREVSGDALSFAQHLYAKLGSERLELPAAVFGSVPQHDLDTFGQEEGLRRAFLRYLDTVRVKPPDMHVHYNDWWTAPVPSSESFVLSNIEALRQGLHAPTGFFFDSYALDMGWSNPHTVWEIDATNFPEGFSRVRDALAAIGSRPGLWVSPSSLYPPALENPWLASAGYEVIPPNHRAACMAAGGKYQTAFKEAVLKHAAEANLAHVKFDGFVPQCDDAGHNHAPGPESCYALAQGMVDVFDALRAQDPGIALEPTCFGYHPSPWWLMHVPFIIGPFGDDCPRGRCPCPEWIESLTTARDIENLNGRDAFLMPSAALQCFDIIVQCPGPFQNHAAMAIGRGRWFISSYINPRFMDAEEWRFFAELIAWGRENREFLQEPAVVGGDPSRREAYGYAFSGPDRWILCLRNPWIEETSFAFPAGLGSTPFSPATELRMLYPRREILARVQQGAPMPPVHLGPYETVFIEAVATDQQDAGHSVVEPEVTWQPDGKPAFSRIVFSEEPAAFGPSWTCPDGDVDERLVFEVSGQVTVTDALSAELCLLCEGGPEVELSLCTLRIDGIETPVTVATSVGAFAATGRPAEGDWTWFLAPLPTGQHRVDVQVDTTNASASRWALFARGSAHAAPAAAPFTPGPAFPLYQPEKRPWSRTLVSPVEYAEGEAAIVKRVREIEHIDGVYLDTLNWTEASAGWGEVQRNLSIMGKPMTMGNRRFHRGIGAHALSRIVYDVPGGYRVFAATIGYDQEVRNGSIVFVIKGDDRELFRSGVVRYDSPPQNIEVTLEGVSRLILIVEDAGDGIGADHGNWANARLLR